MGPAPRLTALSVGRRTGRGPSRIAGEEGSQALEFALLMPFVAMLVVAVLVAGAVAVAAVRTQVVAGQLVRIAAVSHDRRVLATAGPGLDVAIDPASGSRAVGDLVTVRVSRRLRLAGFDVPLSATATALTETVP